MNATYTIRPARPGDAEAIVGLIRELAVYERLEHQAEATADGIRAHLFGSHPVAEALLAEGGGTDGPIGFALFHGTFSTFQGKPGLHLEDLFVKPEHRGLGIGKTLLAEVARIAVDRGCGRLDWIVLNWNAPSIGFYRSLGAEPLDDWTSYRLDGDRLLDVASGSPAAIRGGEEGR